MAMDAATEADLIVTKLQAIFPRMADPAFRPQMIQYWTQVCSGEIQHKIAAMDVLPTSHGGEALSAPAAQPVLVPVTAATGTPSNGATTADTEIVGKGSVE